MERNGIPIWEHPIRQSVETGITFGTISPEIVPEFEAREAAVFCHYRPGTEFEALSLEERARCVAQYRLHHMIENHTQDAISAEAERLSKRR